MNDPSTRQSHARTGGAGSSRSPASSTRLRALLAGLPALFVALLVALLVVSPSPTDGYEGVEVDDAGAVRGRVRHAGGTRSERITVDVDADVCGQEIEVHRVLVGKGDGLEGAVVYVRALERGAPIDRTVRRRMRVDRCRLEPAIIATSTGQVLEFVNADPILHALVGRLGETAVLGINLPMQGMSLDKRPTEPGIIRLEDRDHAWIRGWIRVVPHPYHAVSDARGRFSIEDLPAGTHTLIAWHPEIGEQAIEVEIVADGTVEVEFDALAPADPEGDPEDIAPATPSDDPGPFQDAG